MDQIEAIKTGAAVLLGLLGLIIGSFLNVVIARVPHGQSIVHPRSRCPKCGHQLAWFENIPVFSWLALRGRCKNCRAPISPRYVLVELLTAALFLACLKRFGWSYELVPALVLVMLLIPLTFIDLEHWLLPLALTVPGIGAGIALKVQLGLESVITAVIGAAAGWIAFFLLEIVGEKIFKKEALGGGDKYLLALLGAFLGWQSLLGIVFLSSLQGALIGSLLLLVRGRAGPGPAEAPDGAVTEEGLAAQPEASEVQEEATPSSTSIEAEAEDDWIPGPTNIPYGPWLALAALEIMLLGPWLASILPETLAWTVGAEL